ncbi:MFS multidrug transporter, putative [Talaromyces stipitatus ATCC 10500]|uniref:MFS multidrug transporter, putative n=1 Tax=Talaromyces stipitatus (strain ATCC 10500 / CBS 375.48 / QM 6759 / NRRL 1006) TaxID=441959 RepID=B8M3F1_TALSN|nr:MFS multidrug transporter, putative [Talaromyces stipitatus ATCC 10500]EED22323.1 MFS multidrug transporter, putative [Talaromyces stipitatus ATCC 10500]
MGQHDETTPLLTSPHQNINNDSGTTRQRTTRSLLWSPIQRRVMIAGGLLLLSINFGAFMAQAPQLQIFEDIICKNYMQSIDPSLLNDTIDVCKSPAVQKELALVTGWKNTFDILPSIAMALPYGILADRIGRRPVMIMSFASLICSDTWAKIVCWFNLPLRLTWLAGLFQIPGGGNLVATTMVMTVVADVFSAGERNTAIFRLTAMTTVAEIVATPLSAMMLESDPWIPFILGTVIMISSSLFVFLMPETLGQMNVNSGIQEDTFERSPEDSEETSQLLPTKNDTIAEIVLGKTQEFILSSKFLWTSPRILISIVAVFAGSMDRSSWYLLIQYVSTKFRWSIAEASYLISVRGCMTLATLLVILPILSSFLSRTLHYAPVTKDLYIARFSAASGVLGYLMVSIASSAPILLMGTLFMSFSIPFVYSVISVATSFVPSQNQIATLYAAMSVSISIGGVVASPMFAGLYAVGMQLGVEWSGLPFAVGSGLLLLTLVPILYIKVQTQLEDIS